MKRLAGAASFSALFTLATCAMFGCKHQKSSSSQTLEAPASQGDTDHQDESLQHHQPDPENTNSHHVDDGTLHNDQQGHHVDDGTLHNDQQGHHVDDGTLSQSGDVSQNNGSYTSRGAYNGRTFSFRSNGASGSLFWNAGNGKPSKVTSVRLYSSSSYEDKFVVDPCGSVVTVFLSSGRDNPYTSFTDNGCD